MTPQTLAQLHAAAFAPERGWSPEEFENLLAQPTVALLSRPEAFALVRSVVDETELLTLAVAPGARRRGLADRLMRDWLRTTRATSALLEVASDNSAAQALYAKHGFVTVGRRKAYYQRPGAPAADALLMQAAVTRRQTGESGSGAPKTG